MTKSFSLAIVILVSGILAGGVAAQEDVQKITFSHKPLAQGDVQLRASSMDMSQDITMSMGDMPQEPMNQEIKTSDKRKTSILAVREGKVSKVRMEILDFDFKMLMGGEEPPMGDMGPQDISGKVVIAELTEDGAVKISDEEGNAVDAMLESVASGEFANGEYVGWGPRLQKILPERPIAMNEIINVPTERAMDFLPGYGGATLGQVESMSLKLVGTKRSLGSDLAVFEIDAKFGGAPDLGGMGGGEAMAAMKMSVDVRITGKISIGINNLWVYDMEMKGPMKLTSEASDEMPFSMSSTGNISTRGASIYTKDTSEKK